MLAVIFQAAFYLVHYLPLQEIFKALAVFVQQPFLLLFCTVKKKRIIAKSDPIPLKNCAILFPPCVYFQHKPVILTLKIALFISLLFAF